MITGNQANKQFVDQLMAKWKPVLENEEVEPIKGYTKKVAVAMMLENQERANRGDVQEINEAAPANAMGSSSSSAGNIKIYDPVLISMVRRSAPNLIAFDVCGVQPMSQPTGLVFALRSRYRDQTNTEALFNEANTGFSAENAANAFNFDSQQTGSLPDHTANSSNYTAVSAMTTAQLESLGESSANAYNQMAFSIESVSVTARVRTVCSI